MKTSIWQLIWQWIRSHSKYVIMFAVILFCVIWISVREGVIRHQAARINKLNDSILVLDVKRQDLDRELMRLNNQYAYLDRVNQQMEHELKAKEKELADLKKKHEKTLDSLLNIPPDTVYKKLNVYYPDYDGGDKRFPFSASQIMPIYKTTLSFGFLQSEYSLQTQVLRNCKDLNTGYETGINNLESQISNLRQNIKLADDQIGYYKKEVVTLQNRIGRKSFSVRFWQAASATLTLAGIALLK